MVRSDNIIAGKTRTRREFCSYYTDSAPIIDYMVSKLAIEDGDLIFEPCAGDGVFVKSILSVAHKKDFHLDAVDLNSNAITELKRLFITETRISIRQTDALLDELFDLHANAGGYYSKIIGNPPYGAWQDFEKRKILKKRYGGYVRETYTLFLRRCVNLLRPEGKLVFIIPDTFLALNLHQETREFILKETQVEEILLIPSRFFPGVNFGYSNLCILSLEKKIPKKTHKVNIISESENVNNLYKLSNYKYENVEIQQISQEEVVGSSTCSFLIGSNRTARELINDVDIQLGDIADCVTGFYSGDNKTFLRVKNREVKRSIDYNTVEKELIEENYLDEKNILDGLNNGKKYIPFLKGGNGIFIKSTEWYVDWESKTVDFYKHDKKARFQNSSFYFKEGIGVPMVKSKKINAFLMEKRLFDQSIVGIFPKDNIHFNYLLAFLNSAVCSKMISFINHTANNSANYLKRLPIIIHDDSIQIIDEIMTDFFLSRNTAQTLKNINKVMSQIYKL